MERNPAAILSKLKSISIVKKFMIGYICVIFLPVVSFGFYYYHQISRMVVENLDINHRQIMEQAYNNLKVELAHYESLYKFMQANPFIVNYLDGVYTTDADSVFNYLSYISPQLNYLQAGYSNISDITIYKLKPNVLHIPNTILDASNLSGDVRRKVGKLSPDQGIWLYQTDGRVITALDYYQVIYDNNYTDKLGIMAVKVSANVLEDFLTALRADPNWEIYLQNKQGEILYPAADSGDSGAAAAPPATNSQSDRSVIVNRLSIDHLGLDAVAYGKKNEMFQDLKTKERYLAILVILLLLTLSYAYFWLASSVARRLSQLARHMRSVGNNNLKVYPKLGDMDEIGFLTSSYNAMVKRIEELIDNVHRAETLRKEAAYRALQAQVKPHFLYNTLETIRMMAVAKDVPEVADITYAFGKLMRYSLSSSSPDTTLQQEMEMVKSYLDIHRLRMKNRLHYQIDGVEKVKNVMCPRFILQPVVENCIVHGISKVRRSPWITVAVSENEGCYVITVTDNGVGIAEANLQELRAMLNLPMEDSQSGGRGSFGLRNVSERLRSYYGGCSRLAIDSEEGVGTSIRMFLTKKEG